MNKSFFLIPFFVLTAQVLAADLPTIPTKPIAEKKELLFSDDFESAEPAKVWHRVVPTFVVESGALKGAQARDKTVPGPHPTPR